MMHAHELLTHWIATSGHYTQAELAHALDVSRTAVHRWIKGTLMPSRARAEEIERLSGGAVPARLWPRRVAKTAASPGAQLLQGLAKERGVTVFRLANEVGIDPRALFRWAASENRPRESGVALLNETFGLKLTRKDFEVRA
jgi:transcriptional regulator with XRE-family HTH domain